MLLRGAELEQPTVASLWRGLIHRGRAVARRAEVACWGGQIIFLLDQQATPQLTLQVRPAACGTRSRLPPTGRAPQSLGRDDRRKHGVWAIVLSSDIPQGHTDIANKPIVLDPQRFLEGVSGANGRVVRMVPRKNQVPRFRSSTSFSCLAIQSRRKPQDLFPASRTPSAFLVSSMPTIGEA
jgi:hypothetical protein